MTYHSLHSSPATFLLSPWAPGNLAPMLYGMAPVANWGRVPAPNEWQRGRRARALRRRLPRAIQATLFIAISESPRARAVAGAWHPLGPSPARWPRTYPAARLAFNARPHTPGPGTRTLPSLPTTLVLSRSPLPSPASVRVGPARVSSARVERRLPSPISPSYAPFEPLFRRA